MYEPPKAPLGETPGTHGSLLRGFAGGWGALLLGIALASLPDLGRLTGVIDSPRQHQLMVFAWPLLFLPLLALVVRYAMQRKGMSAFGAILAVVSSVIALVVWAAMVWLVA